MRRFVLGALFTLGCAPHGGEDDSARPERPEVDRLEPETRTPALDPLARALQDFPEDRQELTLALGSRTHRCCYWGADTSVIHTPDGSPAVEWVGPDIPTFVPPRRDDRTLLILDPHAHGWVAFYRQLYGDPGCIAADERSRCTYEAVMFDPAGTQRWAVRLDALFSVTGLAIDDLHWHDGTLYFNEACPMVGTKRCSALVAYDPRAKKVRWRSRQHVSNDAFRIAGDRIVAAFSAPFGSEPGGTSALTVLDRTTGRTLARRELDSMIDEIVVDRDVIQIEARGGVLFTQMIEVDGRLELREVERPKWFDPVVRSLYR